MSETIDTTWNIITLHGIDYVRVEEKVRAAIKLQELVKERISIIKKNREGAIKNKEMYLAEIMLHNIELLQTLVEDSEK